MGHKLIQESTEIDLMPHCLEAEESVLGCIIKDNACLDKAIRYINKDEIFYDDVNRKLFKIIKSLIKNHVVADTVTIVSQIQRDKTDISIYYITGLLDKIVSVSSIETHSRLIYEKYLQRQIINQTYKIQKVAFDDTFGFMKLVDKVRELNDEVIDTKPIKEFDLESLTQSTIKSIGNAENLVSFGFNILDSMAGGMTKGEITVVAGRPGHGKTTFSVNLVKRLLDQGLTVLVLNREMTNEEMIKKFLVLNSQKLSYHNIRTGKLNQDEALELRESQKEIIDRYSKNLVMYDDVSNLHETISLVSRIRPDIIIDDYIQLVKVDNKKDRRFEIEAVMQEYKWLAKKYKCIPILVSQLNRDIERRIDPIPKMSDLAEGSTIEQIAENILFIYYDYKVNYGASELGREKCQIVAAKVRYGTTGMFTIGVNHNKVLFHENIAELSRRTDNEMIHVENEKELKSAIKKFSGEQVSFS